VLKSLGQAPAASVEVNYRNLKINKCTFKKENYKRDYIEPQQPVSNHYFTLLKRGHRTRGPKKPAQNLSIQAASSPVKRSPNI
jgi:hypothetical protein